MAVQQPGTAFVGRDREVADLIGWMEEAAAGRGRIVLLAGEPGIGKSRLAAEAADVARLRGWSVLVGRGWADAGTAAYWPWIQVLRAHLRTADPADLARQIGPGAADLVRLVPEIAEIAPVAPAAESADPEAARFRLFDSVTSLLRRGSERRPIVIVLDDLHAADTPSVLLLRFLVSQIEDSAIGIVASHRELELTPDEPIAGLVEQIAGDPNARRLHLDGLGLDATNRIVERLAAEASPALVSALWRETGGNPLFVEEAVRLLRAEGRLASVDPLAVLEVVVPARVRDVILRRVEHLGDAARSVLGPAAVLGPEFGVDMLGRVASLDPERVIEIVSKAVRAGLLADVAGLPGHYRFTHDLIRESLHDELSPLERVSLHRRIAETIEEVHRNNLDAHLAALAYHALEAARGVALDRTIGDPGQLAERALDYARRAGERAAASAAFEEAARLHRSALAAGTAAGVLDDDARLQLLIALGDVEGRAGNLDASRTVFLAAVDLARAGGRPRELAHAALGYGGRFVWVRAGADTRLVPLLQEALVMLGGADDHLRACLLARLACALRSDPTQRGQCAALSHQAVELARGLGDPSTLGYVLVGRTWAIWWPDNAEERIQLALEMLEASRSAGDAERIVDAHTMLCLSYLDLGEVDRALAEIAELDLRAERMRQPAQIWLGVGQRALIALAVGDFEAAERLMERGLEPGHPATPARDDVSAARMHRFILARERGTVADEEASVRASVTEFPWYPLHRAALANLLVDLDRTDEARGVLRALAQDDFAALYQDNEWLLGMCLAAEAAARLEDRAPMESLYRQLLPRAGRHAIGHPEGSLGAIDRYLGLLAAGLGRIDEAIEHLDAAVVVNARMGLRPWTAHAQADLAALLERRAAPDDLLRAADLRLSARATAEAIGMHVLADRLAGKPAPPTATVDATFRRDGEVWTIAFAGATLTMRDSRGMGHIARLLARPGEELHALDLAAAPGVGPNGGGRSEDGRGTDPFAGAGPHLDAEAKAAYRNRLAELRADVEEAEGWNDAERAARARAEIDALTAELASAAGLGGRDRSAASNAERARLSVTRAIRSAIDRIAGQSEPLGSHLAATIHTGTYCSYRPDPRVDSRWQL